MKKINILKYIALFVTFCLITITSYGEVSVPFTMTESYFNDATVVVSSSGVKGWGHPEVDGAGLEGVCVGDFGGGFNWNDKYVDIAFQGEPDSLFFDGEAAALTTGIEWYVKESPDGVKWSSKIWTSSSRMVNNIAIKLSSDTRYIRLCYSGNFRGCFSDVTISKGDFKRLQVVVDNKIVRDEFVEVGQPISVETPTALECHEFNGWDQEIPSVMPSNDLVITALLTVHQLTSIFQPSDESLGMSIPEYTKTFDCGSAVSVEKPSFLGYTFKGWDPELPTTAAMSMDGVTYVGQWEKTLYNYKVYGADQNQPVISTQHYYGDVVEVVEEEPTRIGYTFAGWDKEFPETMPAADLTIRAKWNMIDYFFVVYTSDEDSVVTKLNYGSRITKPRNPTRVGWTFEGWDAEIPTTMPAEDLRVHAIWSENTYRCVVYVTDDDSTVYLRKYGEELPILSDPENKGFDFVGWNMELPETMPAKDLIIRAVWTNAMYKLTFVDGEDVLFEKSIPYESAVDLSEMEEPTKTGFYFMGWDRDLPKYMPFENLTYSAVWKAKSYQLILVKNIADASSNDTLSIEFQKEITNVLDPDSVGYSFVKWVPELPEFMPAEDVTVTAVWSQNIYRYVVYETEDDSTVVELTYGAKVPELKASSRDGYTFLQWDVEIPATMPATDYVVHAVWSQNTYRFVVYTSDLDSTEALFHYGDPLPTVENPSMVGYDFLGWNKDVPSVMPNSDYVIKAKWEAITYKLVLRKGLDFKPSADTILMKYKDPISVESPVHEGCVFEKWNPELPQTMPASDVVADAVWSNIKYRYVVYYNDEDSVVAEKFYGQPLEPLEDQVMEGYVFIGWDKVQPATMPAENLTIKAIWNTDKYKLNLLIDGEVYYTHLFSYGEAVELVDYENPNKPGYSFVDWDGTIPSVMPSRNLSFEAIWSVNQYTLTIINDDEDDSKTEVFTYKYNATVNEIEEPSKLGYEFEGWNNAVPEKMPARNVILVAQWSPKEYSLNFMDGEELLMTKVYKYNDLIDYKSLHKPSKDGSVFIGWGDAPATMPAKDVTLSAVWSTNAYRIVVVNDLDDKLKNDTIYYEYGSSILPLQEPAKVGYEFNGWNETLPSVMPDENLTVVAKWSIKTYTLTTLVNCKPTITYYTFGNPVSLKDPQEKGYDFKGWSEEVPSVMPGRDVLLVADMELLHFDLVTRADGDTLNVVTYNYNETVQYPSVPQKRGFTFKEWSPSLPSVMPDSNVVLDAVWDRNTYNVSWVLNGDTVVESYLFEDKIQVYKDTTKVGYSFRGWDQEIPENMPANDMVFVADWVVNTYNLVLIEDENDTTVVRFAYGEPVAVDNPSKMGSTFSDWIPALPTTMPAHNDTLSALWTLNKYQVLWKSEDDTLKIDSVPYGSTVPVLSDPEKKGARFLGWDQEIASIMPARDLEYVAEWEDVIYMLAVVSNGDTTVARYKYGQLIDQPSDTVREGYTFGGWLPAIPETMPDSSLLVEALWSVNSYKLILVNEESRDTSMYEFLEEIKIEIPERKGYTFEEWVPAIPGVMPANDVEVKAMWSVNYYDLIKINHEGDTLRIVKAYGEAIEPFEDPQLKGFTFAGWNSIVPETMPAEDMTIEALWNRNQYMLIVNDGNKSDSIPYMYEDTIRTVADPVREGYEFVGWSDDIPELMLADNVVLEAMWKQNIFELTLVTDSDTMSVKLPYGEIIDVEDPERVGFTFAGWSPKLPEVMPAMNLISESMWEVNKYTLSLVVDNDTTNTEYSYLQNVVKPTDPVKQGYTFSGWDVEFPETMPAKDVTIVGSWTVNSYNLTLVVNDSVSQFEYSYGDTIQSVTDPDKEGYTFAGWSKELPVVMPAEDLQLEAVWSINTHYLHVVVLNDTFSFRYDYSEKLNKLMDPGIEGMRFVGWSSELPDYMPDSDFVVSAVFADKTYNLVVVVDDNTSVYSLAFNEKISVDSPSKEGHTFEMWQPELPEFMPDSNLTVVAVWNRNVYNFKVIMDQDTVLREYLYGDTIEVPEVVARKGYEFQEWSDSLPELMPAHGITVHAIYAKVDYTLKCLSDGEVISEMSYNYGDKVETPSTPTKAGYSFLKWDRELPATMPDSDVVINAVWKKNLYDLTFVVDDDTVVYTYEFGAEVEELKVAEKEGYKFEGWSEELPKTMPSRDLTLVAIRTLNVYDFTYVTHKKTVSVSYSYGDSIEIPSNPTRKGYTFVGWSDTIPAVMPSQDVKVNAVWQANLYNVTVISDGVVIMSLKVPYGESFELPNSVEKNGYVFTGWDEEVPSEMPAKNLTFSAKFKCKNKLVVYTNENILYVKGLPSGVEFVVVDILGRVVYRGTETEIPLMRAGTYIVKAKNQQQKVIIR